MVGRLRILSGMVLACAAIASHSGVLARAIAASSEPLARQLATIETGDQLVVGATDGDVSFGGYPVQLDGFSGIFGYASEVAYVIVVDGRASIEGTTAARGRMLLIRPFGAGISSERFDATRLQEALGEGGEAELAPDVLASLERLAAAQRRGMFLGRLAQTNFNVASLGSAEAEMGRRNRVGGAAVREARFAPPAPGIAIEQTIVERFLAALARGDTAASAQFLDPLPYGYSGPSDEGRQAREAMAAALIEAHDWSRFADAQADKAGEASWLVQGNGAQARIALRRTTEFAFVQSIEVAE